MNNAVITKKELQFLKDLKKNNTREWFAEHKTTYKNHEAVAKNFYGAIKDKLNEHDEIEKLKMFRIYRDVRFSKDKTPYQPHFAGSFSRAGARLRGGYYLRVRPGESFMAIGFWEPNKEDLFRIRKEIELDASDLKEVISLPEFKKIWGEFQGETLKTSPKGFDKEHPEIELLRRKQFVFTKEFTDAEVVAPDFLETVSNNFKVVRPYFDLMSNILTTNLNGESMLD